MALGGQFSASPCRDRTPISAACNCLDRAHVRRQCVDVCCLSLCMYACWVSNVVKVQCHLLFWVGLCLHYYFAVAVSLQINQNLNNNKKQVKSCGNWEIAMVTCASDGVYSHRYFTIFTRSMSFYRCLSFVYFLHVKMPQVITSIFCNAHEINVSIQFFNTAC